MTIAIRALPRAAWDGELGFNLPWLALAPLLLIPVLGSDAGASGINCRPALCQSEQ